MASSDSESYHIEYEYECLAQKIIAEVEKRPLLYDTKLRKRSDKILKIKLWNQVYSSIYKDWKTMPETEKRKRAKLVQKKWKNIRDCFFKELSMREGGTAIKKKKYIHFDSLLFLLSPSQKRVTGNIRSSFLEEDNSNESSNSRHNIDETASTQTPSQSTDNNDYHQRLIETSSAKEGTSAVEYDEDVSFSQMIVPILRKLNDDQKHFARIEIMTVLQNAKYRD